MQSQVNIFRKLNKKYFKKRFLQELGYIDRPQYHKLAIFAEEILSFSVPSSIVIDLGAGSCRWKKLFPDCKYIGTDSTVGDPNCNYNNLDFIADITQKTPIHDNIADVVICMAVLGHVFNPLGVFKEAYRILKPGGMFFAMSEFAKAKHQTPYDAVRLTDFMIKRYCQETGFEIIDIYGSNSFYTSILDLIENYAWKTKTLFSWFIRILIKTRIFNLLYKIDFDSSKTNNLFPVYFFIKAKKPLNNRKGDNQ